jgi:hypothetical protein
MALAPRGAVGPVEDGVNCSCDEYMYFERNMGGR